MKKVLFITTLCVISIVFFFYRELNYWFVKFRYGSEYNNVRKELKVPLIEPHLVSNINNPNFWVRDNKSDNPHRLKQLQFHNYGISIERDDFVFISSSGEFTVICYYHYQSECFNNYLVDVDGKTLKISSYERDSIFAVYGYKNEEIGTAECLVENEFNWEKFQY